MGLVYNPPRNEAIFISNGAVRSTEIQTLTVPNQYSDDTVHTFIAFISADGKDVSNSRYIGSVVATA